MTFLEPSNLHWLWLAALPLVLWLFRRQAKRVPVSTLLFFRTLAKEHQESAWLRQIKRWLSLLLTLLVIATAALTLARPTFSNRGSEEQRALVVLLDRSASMAAVDAGRSRLDAAKELIHRRIRTLPEDATVSLVVYADTAIVPVSRSRNKRELLRYLSEVSTLPAEDRIDLAWAAASRLALVDKPATILHVSDRALPDSLAISPEIRYERGPVESAQTVNAGITGFALRAAPLERHRYDVFLRVSAAGANASTVPTSIELKLGGRLIQLRELKLKPGEETSFSLPLEGPGGELLEVRTMTPGDQLGLDDVLLVPLPSIKPVVVAWISENPDPFTDLALGAMVDAGRLEVLRGTPANWPLGTQPDAYVFENWQPENWTPDAPVVLLNPSAALGSLRFTPLERGVPVERIRSLNADHPVLHGISTSRLSLTQITTLGNGEGLETLWMAGDEPLLLAGEYSAKRIVVAGFSPARSEQLALLPALPLLLGNAIQWCVHGGDSDPGSTLSRPGTVIEAQGDLQWTTWDGQRTSTRLTSTKGGLAPLTELGAWQTADGRRGATALISFQETNLTNQPDQTTTVTPTGVNSWWSWPVTSSLLLFVLLLLLVESWLFHRRAVY